MKGFVYFIPGLQSSATRADFLAVGLGHALTVGDPSSRGTSNGPAGLAGQIAVPTHPLAAAALYEPEKQVWQAGPDGKYFVGYNTDAPPGPDSLARARVVPGETIELGDGNRWVIPIALSFVESRGSTLPRRFMIGADGKTWEMSIEPAYVHLCDMAEEIVQAWLGGETSADGSITVKLDVLRSLEICTAALACNYRVGAIELSLLGLINTDTRWQICKALIDMIAKEAVDSLGEKKSGSTPATSAT